MELKLSIKIFIGFLERREVSQLFANVFALIYSFCLGLYNIMPLEATALDCTIACCKFYDAWKHLGDTALYFYTLDFPQAAQAVVNFKNVEIKEFGFSVLIESMPF